MTPSQRTILLALAAGALGFVVLFALGVWWPIAAGLGLGLGASAWFTLNYLAPTDLQSELDDNLRRIEKASVGIRVLSNKVADDATRSSLLAGCGEVPQLITLIRQRDVRVAVPLSQRSLTYTEDVLSTLEDYVGIQDGADPEYLAMGQQELQRFATFTAQPDKDLSARKMDDYISSLTALNLNPPPELT